jgi:2-polyprenyl-3-methyl-5-hydroxy-6-metoxy-1,4-benzoquinol methylase
MMRQDFSRRSHQLEMMDADAIGFEDFRQCLRDLELVNVGTLAYRPTLRWLKAALRDDKFGQPVSILDVGSGGGDMLRTIWQWAERRGHKTCLAGVDRNPWSKKSAESVTPPGAPIQYETDDIFSFDPGRRADFIISSLFTHHLTDDEVVQFLRWMDRHATRGWFINDLHRHPLPFFVIRYLTRLLRFSPMVQHDGPVSVTRAFTAADWRRLIGEAGIPAERIRISWFFPFRYCVAGRTQVA